jgi:L-ascorbate metabolism protein UlaG (beta-lactamase superfamily)
VGWLCSHRGVGLRVYRAGDRAYGPFFAEIGARYPGIDIALLPIAAYSPRWSMQTMVVDPEEAAQASATPVPGAGADALGPFWLTREPALEPIEPALVALGRC